MKFEGLKGLRRIKVPAHRVPLKTNRQDFNINSTPHRKPMKSGQHGRNVVSLFGASAAGTSEGVL